MRVSISFSGFAPIEPSIAAVRAAEAAGLDGVWSAEHITYHDAIVPTALFLRETTQMEVGIVGLTPYSRHPGMLAMELSSLSELAKGRLRVQVGTGDPTLVAKLGRQVRRPVQTTTTFIQTLRQALGGSDMKIQHDEYAFDQFKLTPIGPVPPIDMLAIRPKMLEGAAQVADGVSLSVGASRQYLAETVTAIEKHLTAAGRSREGFRITALVVASINDDLKAARAPLLPLFAMFPPDSAVVLAKGVLDPIDFPAAAAKSGPLAVMKMFTPEVIDQLALVATPDGLGEALSAYADTGIDELGLMLMNDPVQQPDLCKHIAAARDALLQPSDQEASQ